MQTEADLENGGCTVFNISIVNDKGCRAEIGVRHDNGGTFLTADVVGEPFVGFYCEALLIGIGMGRSDRIHIIGTAVAYGAEVTVANPASRF